MRNSYRHIPDSTYSFSLVAVQRSTFHRKLPEVTVLELGLWTTDEEGRHSAAMLRHDPSVRAPRQQGCRFIRSHLREYTLGFSTGAIMLLSPLLTETVTSPEHYSFQVE